MHSMLWLLTTALTSQRHRNDRQKIQGNFFLNWSPPKFSKYRIPCKLSAVIKGHCILKT